MNDVALRDVKIDEFGRGPHLADGMNLCAGCEDVFTLGRYCGFCQAVDEDLADRYGDDAQKATRVQMGVVPVDPYGPGKPASLWAVALVFFGAVCSAMFMFTGLWFLFRALVAFCLKHS